MLSKPGSLTKLTNYFVVEIGANHRKVKVIEPNLSNSTTSTKITNDQICTTKSPVPSPRGDGYGCNRLSGDYAYSVPVGNGNYIYIKGNDPELTKVTYNYVTYN